MLQKKEWQKNVAQSHLFEKQHLDWILEIDTEVQVWICVRVLI